MMFDTLDRHCCSTCANPDCTRRACLEADASECPCGAIVCDLCTCHEVQRCGRLGDHDAHEWRIRDHSCGPFWCRGFVLTEGGAA